MDRGARSFLSAPLLIDGQAVGELSLTSQTGGAFGAEEREIVQEVTAPLSVAVQQTRLRDEIASRAAEHERRLAERGAAVRELGGDLDAPDRRSRARGPRAPLRQLDGYAAADPGRHRRRLSRPPARRRTGARGGRTPGRHRRRAGAGGPGRTARPHAHPGAAHRARRRGGGAARGPAPGTRDRMARGRPADRARRSVAAPARPGHLLSNAVKFTAGVPNAGSRSSRSSATARRGSPCGTTGPASTRRRRPALRPLPAAPPPRRVRGQRPRAGAGAAGGGEARRAGLGRGRAGRRGHLLPHAGRRRLAVTPPPPVPRADLLLVEPDPAEAELATGCFDRGWRWRATPPRRSAPSRRWPRGWCCSTLGSPGDGMDCLVGASAPTRGSARCRSWCSRPMRHRRRCRARSPWREQRGGKAGPIRGAPGRARRGRGLLARPPRREAETSQPSRAYPLSDTDRAPCHAVPSRSCRSLRRCSAHSVPRPRGPARSPPWPAILPAEAQRAAPPAATGVPDIPFQKFVLKNGLTLIVHEDHKAPIVAVNVWYHVGSKNEKPRPHRLRPPLRAPDVQRQRELQRRLLHAVRAGGRHRPERHDQRGPDQLLPERAHQRAGHGALDGVRPDGPPARRHRPGQARRAARRGAEREAAGREPALRQGVRLPHVPHVPGEPSVFLDADRLDGGPRRRQARGREGVVPDLLRRRPTR